ncbi:MAG: preQ(1) synthase [Rectinema sp.]|uniref:NADPH-dependent 7-cyano-7-deazaguanine reductase n=1 Tax=uncultured spirochete TaxID=156406 RepID=A0A3P3XMY1_9SPIR|nr:NADPH-dependent 7-cyano-7-deazaguanine reductase [uncultured spirochete]
MAEYEFKSLGKTTRAPSRELETFPTPPSVTKVVLESDEVTSLCPVTGQPDWETVRIEFEPGNLCIESKSLKLYLWSFREEGVFCEALAARIAKDVFDAIKPKSVAVSITQKPRGGITISAEARLPKIV